MLNRFRWSLASLVALVAFIVGVVPASSASMRRVTVVNLMAVSATVQLDQGSRNPMTGTIESRRDRVFEIPDYNTTLVVTATACPNGKRIAVPAKPNEIRFVINPGCALSVQ
jgi:hypothetical protein